MVSKDSDCGLSAYSFLYSSSAAPGGGVIFTSQTNLNGSSSGHYTMGSILMVLMMVAMVLVG